MKRMMMAVAVAVAMGVAQAEEKSFLGNLLSLVDNSAETTVDSEAAKDSAIAKLIAQIADLKAKIKSAKSLPEDTLNAYKQKLEELKKQLNAKVEEFKAAQQKAADEAKATKDANEREATQAKEEGKGLLESIGNLFK